MRDRLKLLYKISAFILFMVACTFKVQAQSYPVQINVALKAPYSAFLTDYTEPGAQKFTASFLLRDLNVTDYKGKLRLTIEGVGITIRTKANYVPLSPITLYGGESLTLFGEDLEEYFNPNNLDFAGISRSQYEKGAKLPEGVYRFTLEMLDYNRSTLVSNKGTAVAWVILNDPPLLNLPRNDTKAKIIDPTNIAFTWTPRHTGSPNSAFTTEYIFKLVEIWPATRNPYDAFLSQQSLYETTTTSTQIVYGPAEPALIPGRKYAWQVQAKDIEDRDLFKNQGKSEVYVFQFGDALGVPENLRKNSGNANTISLAWEPPSQGANPVQYRVRYRVSGTARRDIWYEAVTDDDQRWVTIPDLKNNTEYELQIRSEAAPQYSEYSQVLLIKTDIANPTNYVCGKEDEAAPVSTSSVLMALVPGDIVACGKFKIKVINATGSNGNFTGDGWMAVPAFNGANIRVNFSGQVNNGHELITGGYESVYNQGSPMAQAIDDANNIGADTDQFFDKKDNATTVTPDYTVPGIIDNIYVDADGKIVVVDTEGNKSTYDQKKDEKTGKVKATVIADASGNSYTVDKEGKVTKNESTGGNTNNGNGIQTDDIKDKVIVLLLEQFDDQISAWLRNNGKGGDEDEDVLLAAGLPACFPKDADVLKSLQEKEIPYYKEKPQELRAKIEADENNLTLFDEIKSIFQSKDGVELSKIPDEKRTLATDETCEALMDGYSSRTNPLTEKILAKIKEIHESSGKEVVALVYCKECKNSPKALEKTKGNEIIIMSDESKVCLGLIFKVEGGNVYVDQGELVVNEQTKNLGALSFIMPTLGSSEKESLGIYNASGTYGSCTNFLDQNFFNRFDYCTTEPTESLYDNLLTAVGECITSAKANAANTLDDIVKAADNTLSNNIDGEKLKVIVSSEGKTKEAGEKTNPSLTISYTKGKDGKWTAKAEFSEEYIKKLAASPYFKKYGDVPKILKDFTDAMDELMLKAQVQFCDPGAVDPNCVTEQLRFLQVLSINLENVAKEGVVHEAMWRGDNGKRHLLPSDAQWTPVAGGVVDEVVEEGTSIPMLVKTIWEVSTDEEKQQALQQVFTENGYYKMRDAFLASMGEMIVNEDVRNYKLARFTVMMAFLYYAIVEGAAKSLDDALQEAAELTNKVENAPSIRKYLAEVAKLEKKGIPQTKQLKELVDNIGVEKLEAMVKQLDSKNVKELLDDLASSKTLRDALVDQPDLAKGWLTMYNALGRTSQFAKDIPTLEHIVAISREGSAFRTKLGDQWSEALDDILKTAKDLKCSTCTSGRVGRSPMDQFLADSEYFISNFNISSGGNAELFYNWMRGKTKSGKVPLDNQLDEVHQTLRDLANRNMKQSEVASLGGRFELGNNEFDLRLVRNRYIEYKNKDFVSKSLVNNSDDIDQFINGYLRNIKSLGDLEWQAGFDKLKNSWGTPENALFQMKKQWKKVFKEKANEIFDANSALFNKLKLKDGTLVSDSDLFKEYLDEITETNELFDFIKVE